MNQPPQNTCPARAGFSLIELLVVFLLLSVVLGAVFSQINLVQQRARTEQVKLDIFQESREFLDQMVRDLRQAGYPNIRMFDTTGWSPPLNATPRNDTRLAAGLTKIAPDELVFEGDMDGDGQVDVLDYKGNMVVSGGGNNQYNGAVFLAKTRDAQGNVLPSLAGTRLDWSGGGGNGVYYSSGCIDSARTLVHYKVLAVRELPL